MKLSRANTTLFLLTAALLSSTVHSVAHASPDDGADTHCILAPEHVRLPIEGYATPAPSCHAETCIGETCTRTRARDGTACRTAPSSETSPVGGCFEGECLPAAPPEECQSTSTPLTCTQPAPALASLPDFSTKWELAMPPAVSAATLDLVDVSAVLALKTRGGALRGSQCSTGSSIDASIAVRAKVAGVTEAFALHGGGAYSQCRALLCEQPPAYSCATEGGCESVSGYINGSIARTSEVDLGKKFPLLEKLGRVRGSLAYGLGVGVDATLRDGVPTGICRDCCQNGARSGNASMHVQLGAKGNLTTRISLFGDRFGLDLGVSATLCGQGSLGLETTCEGSVRPRADFQVYAAFCLESAGSGLDKDGKVTARRSNNSEEFLRLPLSDFFDVTIEVPRCIKEGSSALCPAAL